jgi:hypothetical protein
MNLGFGVWSQTRAGRGSEPGQREGEVGESGGLRWRDRRWRRLGLVFPSQFAPASRDPRPFLGFKSKNDGSGRSVLCCVVLCCVVLCSCAYSLAVTQAVSGIFGAEHVRSLDHWLPYLSKGGWYHSTIITDLVINLISIIIINSEVFPLVRTSENFVQNLHFSNNSSLHYFLKSSISHNQGKKYYLESNANR